MTAGLADVAGIRLWYETVGDADDPPVLLIAGLGSQALSWDDELCERLAAARRFVIRFDNRDVGLSSKTAPFDRYALADMATDAWGLLEALEIHRAHLVGRSMGGMIAQQMAVTCPSRTATLTSIFSTPGPPEDPDDLPGEGPDPGVLEILRAYPGDTDHERIEHAMTLARAFAGPAFPPDDDATRARARRALERSFDHEGQQRQALAVAAAPSRRRAHRTRRHHHRRRAGRPPREP
jgi:pimeloyl-ACP methyl ester carboxylesterase